MGFNEYKAPGLFVCRPAILVIQVSRHVLRAPNDRKRGSTAWHCRTSKFLITGAWMQLQLAREYIAATL